MLLKGHDDLFLKVNNIIPKIYTLQFFVEIITFKRVRWIRGEEGSEEN